MDIEKRGYNEREAALYLGVSVSYLRHDRCHGAIHKRTPGPVFVQLGRSVRYLKEDLDTWLNKHRVKRTVHL